MQKALERLGFELLFRSILSSTWRTMIPANCWCASLRMPLGMTFCVMASASYSYQYVSRSSRTFFPPLLLLNSPIDRRCCFLGEQVEAPVSSVLTDTLTESLSFSTSFGVTSNDIIIDSFSWVPPKNDCVILANMPRDCC